MPANWMCLRTSPRIQTPGVFISTMARDAFGGRERSMGTDCGRGDGVAVEGDDAEGVAGERDPVHFGGAGVEDVEHEALALLDAQRLAEAEHLAVDGGDVVSGSHVAVVAGLELAVPVVEVEEDFGVVVAGVAGGFDDEESRSGRCRGLCGGRFRRGCGCGTSGSPEGRGVRV